MKLFLKNIGPFHESTLNISDVTLIAGINDTGKSYLNKILFSVLKTLCINIQSDLLENFLRLPSSISFFLKRNIRNIKEKENKINKKVKKRNEEEKLNVFEVSINDLITSLDSFEGLELNNLILKDFLDNYLNFLNQNQEKINTVIKELNLFKINNKNMHNIFRYRWHHLEEILEIASSKFEKIIDELSLILKKDESYIYSMLSNNIFNENFEESIKNKNYFDENSNLTLSSLDSEIIKISINNKNEIKIKINKNLNPYNDVTYISDTFKIFKPVIYDKELKERRRREHLFLSHYTLNSDISDIFAFKSCNYESDFDSKIVEKNENALNIILFKEELKLKFQSYFLLNHKINKDNDSFVNERGINIKFINSSKGLKIIEAFNQLIDTSIFSQDKFLILDEPEAFLHPEWQYLFVKWLLDISNSIKNFKLIISTHSPYIIEIMHSFSERQFSNLNFSYNLLTKNDQKDSIIENEEYPKKINSVLNYPFMRLEDDEIKWDNQAKIKKNI